MRVGRVSVSTKCVTQVCPLQLPSGPSLEPRQWASGLVLLANLIPRRFLSSASVRAHDRLLDRLPGDFRAVFTEDAAATGAEAVRAGLADGGGGQRGVQADLVLAAFPPLLCDRLLAWTLPVSEERDTFGRHA